jgi:hypothetical protein
VTSAMPATTRRPIVPMRSMTLIASRIRRLP